MEEKKSNSEMAKDTEENITKEAVTSITILLLGCLFCAICVSLIAPFFPQLAESKGVKPGEQSFVFMLPELTGLLGTFVTGKIIPDIGVKFVWGINMFSTCFLVCLFGILEFSPQSRTFLSLALAIRFFEGFAVFATYVSGATLTLCLVPGKSGIMLTLSDSFISLGFALGPFVGGLLYEKTGFFLTFLCSAGMTAAVAVVGILLLPTPSTTHSNQHNDWVKLMRDCKIWISLMLIINGGFALVYFQNILSLHLEVYHLSKLQVGGLFCGVAFAYVITAMCWSHVGETCPSLVPFLTVTGLASTAVLYVFLGPATFITLPNEHNALLRTCSILVLSSATLSTFSMQFGLLAKLLTNSNSEASIATQSMISALAASCLSIGMIISAVVSGYVYEYYGFNYACTVIFLVEAFITVLVTIHYLTEYCREISVKEDVKQ